MENSKKVELWRCPICYKLYYDKKDADYCHQDRTCNTCGKIIGKKDYYSSCRECRNKKTEEKLKSAFDKAEKIHYKDYDGYFIYDNEERIKDIDELGDCIYYQIKDSEDCIEIPDFFICN